MTERNVVRALACVLWGGALLIAIGAPPPGLATTPSGQLQGTFVLDSTMSDIDGPFCSPIISSESLSGNGTAILSADGLTVSFEGTLSSSTAGSFSFFDSIDVLSGTGVASSNNSPAGSGALFDLFVSNFVLSGDTFTFELFVSQQSGTGQDCNSSGLQLHLVGSGRLVSSLDSSSLVPQNVAGTVSQASNAQQTGAQQYAVNIGSRPGTAIRARQHGQMMVGQGPSMRAIADGVAFESGLAAGGLVGMPFGLWGSVSYSESDDDFVTTAFDQDQLSVFGGIDLWPTDRVVIGVALGYDSIDVDTIFNGGEQDIDGGTVAVYAGALFTDNLSADLSVGYSSLDTDQFRTPGGVRVTSETDTERVILTGNLNYTRPFGNFLITGIGGVLWAHDDVEAFIESNGTSVAAFSFDLGQLRFGAEAAYTWGSFEPFARGNFVYDWQKTKIDYAAGVPEPDRDRTGGEFGVGFRYYGLGRLSASLEYSGVFARSYDQGAVNFLLRGEFD